VLSSPKRNGCSKHTCSWKNWRPFFSHHHLCQFCSVTPVYSLLKKTDDLFIAYYCHFLLISLASHHPGGCHPTPLLPVQPRFSTILCKFAHKKNFPSGVTPLEDVTRGGPPPPSDATGWITLIKSRPNIRTWLHSLNDYMANGMTAQTAHNYEYCSSAQSTNLLHASWPTTWETEG